ncbi:MAG: hypothetical protein AAB555_01605 [Patescibacteria group bacterium]
MDEVMEKLNKLSLPATILIASIVLGGFYYASQVSKQNSIEKQQKIELQAKKDQENVAALEAQQKQEQADLAKQQAQVSADLQQQQKAKAEAAINKCITDAYSEMKTLQGNYEALGIAFCVKNPDYSCGADSRASTEKAKMEAFATYQNEWVPQCKLGKRVFIHYEPISASSLING